MHININYDCQILGNEEHSQVCNASDAFFQALKPQSNASFSRFVKKAKKKLSNTFMHH